MVSLQGRLGYTLRLSRPAGRDSNARATAQEAFPDVARCGREDQGERAPTRRSARRSGGRCSPHLARRNETFGVLGARWRWVILAW